MTDPRMTQELRAAFGAQASQVTPAPDALSAIRARVGVARRRRRIAAFGLGALATAAAAALAVLFVLPAPPLPPPAPGASGSATVGPSGPPQIRLPVYEGGQVAGRGVLYREYHAVPVGDATLATKIRNAVTDMISGRPLDPDYRNDWSPSATVRAVRTSGDTITIDLSPGTDQPGDPALAVQQLVYTATAVAASQGETELAKVRILVNGAAADRLWGLSTAASLLRASSVDILAPVWLSSPQQGDTVGRGFDVQIVGTVPAAVATLAIWDDTGHLVKRLTVPLDAGAPKRGEAHVAVTLVPGRYRLQAYYLDGDTASAVDDHEITVRD